MNGDKQVMFKEKRINETEWKLGEDANSMWNEMAHCITSVAKEVLGESRGNRLTEQERGETNGRRTTLMYVLSCLHSGKGI